jgi:hypothetical protein
MKKVNKAKILKSYYFTLNVKYKNPNQAEKRHEAPPKESLDPFRANGHPGAKR